eukprot:1947157-Rhodomonas_salina.1
MLDDDGDWVFTAAGEAPQALPHAALKRGLPRQPQPRPPQPGGARRNQRHEALYPPLSSSLHSLPSSSLLTPQAFLSQPYSPFLPLAFSSLKTLCIPPQPERLRQQLGQAAGMMRMARSRGVAVQRERAVPCSGRRRAVGARDERSWRRDWMGERVIWATKRCGLVVAVLFTQADGSPKVGIQD